MKHLTKTLAVVSLLMPMSAQPLGIGDLKLHSALNEKLDAEIHLHLAAGENPGDIAVRLAPPEKFDQAGVPWNYFLSKIRFKSDVQPNGSVVVKVTSREPLTEPFLDFLLEVVWPQGSQFREFTVLVDPPAEYHAPTSPRAASVDYRVEPIAEYEPPVRRARTGKKRTSRAEVVAQHITTQTPTSGEYGPIQNAETLWKIAQRIGSERNVPTQQMMYALFNANPEAFNQGNIDLLKAGAVLKIPEAAAILQTAGKAGDKPARKPAAPAVTDGGKALELVAPADAKVSDKAEAAGPGQPGADGAATGGSGSGDGKDLELQTRIDRLEQQLNMMQQLLALKDQQLAALQSGEQQVAQQAEQSAQTLPAQPQQAEAPAGEPSVPPQPAAPADQATAVAPQQPAPAEVKPAPEAPRPKPVAPPPTPPVEEPDFFSSSAYYLTVGGMGFGIMGVLGWLLWRKRKIESQTNTESMFASASQIRMPDSDSALSVPVMDISSTGAYDVGTVGESSFISDFTPSDFEAFDTDSTDIDPMSEADVYLAYGRYQQAEDLIRHAIEDQPEKDDYKLKLLEIFYANENKQGFAAYAQELVDAGKNADWSFWNKVTDMAKEIIPESALFGGVAKAAADAVAEKPNNGAAKKAAAQQQPASFDNGDDGDFASGNDDDLIDLKAPTLPDMELMDEVNSELAEMQLTVPDGSDDNSLDFDLNSFTKTDKTSEDAAEEVAATVPDIESIDFDLSDIGKADESKVDETKSEPSEPLEGFDFSFDLDEDASAAEKSVADQPLDMDALESFEFPEFADADLEEKPSQEQSVSADSENASGSDEFDFNFDFDAPSSGAASKNADDDVDFGVSDLTDMDEFETKIDLAKAYIDMGDADAAKAIAEEVLEKGNSEQKQAAKAMLDELK